MKVALVHDWLTGMRGGEKCLAAAARRWPDAPLFTLLHVPGAVAAQIEARTITASWLNRLPGVRRYYRGLAPLFPRAVESLRLPADVDCVVSFSHAVAGRVRVPAGAPHVCYCFTPMRYAWHLRDEYLPHGRRSPLAAVKHRLLDGLREWDRRTSRGVTRFVACSRAVAGRIEEAYGRTSDVIYPPVDTDFYTPADVPREDYYLCVSALVPYKRLELAIDACNATGRRLLVIGQGTEAARLRRRGGPTIEFLGWCDDATIRYHLRRCRALIFPGREDFGIVPVEAQACGAPVVAWAIDGALETLIPATRDEPGTAVFFQEATVAAIVAALDELERGELRLSSDLARRQALRFGVQRFGDELVSLVAETVTERHGALGHLRVDAASPSPRPSPGGRGGTGRMPVAHGAERSWTSQ